MSKKSLESMAQTLDRFTGEIPPQDLLILSMGFFAGTQGYTPITALMNVIGGQSGAAGNIDIQKLKDGKLRDAAAVYNMTNWSPMGGILFQMISGVSVNQAVQQIDQSAAGKEPLTPEEIKAQKDYVMATIALGCVGAIEAYTITRPGFLSGVGQIVQGIGDIIPG